jgi:hypothetical protein
MVPMLLCASACSLVLGDVDHFDHADAGVADSSSDTSTQDVIADTSSTDVSGDVVTSECTETGLVAFYRFDEGSGTTTTDCVTGAGATLMGGTTWVPGHRASALQFDGTTGFVDIGKNHLGFNNAPFTVSVWVNMSTVAPAFIVGKELAGANTGWRLGLVGNTITLRVGTGLTSVTAASGSEAGLAGTWAHIAATYDTAAILYVNGTSVATVTQVGAILDDPLASAHMGDSSDSQFFYHGAVDDLRVYSRALSGSEVQALSKQ